MKLTCRINGKEVNADVAPRLLLSDFIRHEKAMSLLSGGLDSSLLAWVEAQERKNGQYLSFLTSVAPPGSTGRR